MKTVYTGRTEDGRSIFEKEVEVAPTFASMAPDLLNFPIFATMRPEAMLARSETEADDMPFFPPPGALRAFQLEIRPVAESSDHDPTPEELDEAERLFPGLFPLMELDDPGMHCTDTVDFVVVLSGEVVLELDDGAERTLLPGDTVVQRGTRHRWRNDSDRPLRLFVVMLGINRASASSGSHE